MGFWWMFVVQQEKLHNIMAHLFRKIKSDFYRFLPFGPLMHHPSRRTWFDSNCGGDNVGPWFIWLEKRITLFLPLLSFSFFLFFWRSWALLFCLLVQYNISNESNLFFLLSCWRIIKWFHHHSSPSFTSTVYFLFPGDLLCQHDAAEEEEVASNTKNGSGSLILQNHIDSVFYGALWNQKQKQKHWYDFPRLFPSPTPTSNHKV